MSNEIIVVKQIPIIQEQLAEIKAEVARRVEEVTSLVCTENTVKEIKKERAALNAEFKAWEEKRKEVKAAVMNPYMKFEAVYSDCVSNTYKKADADLKAKIDSVEKELKEKKAVEVREYFEEYRESNGIDFVTFEQANINVTLSASLKSLKEQAKAFIDKINDDLTLIDTQEHKAEILVEYRKTLNASAAITGVNARIKAIEDEKKRIEEAELRKAAEEQHISEVRETIAEPVVPPVVEPIAAPVMEKAEPTYTLRFTVTATKPKLRELKAFLDNGGYKYE